jgi:hypothetical protein
MARFVAGTPITSREPTMVVDAGLPVGRHRFRLEVVDSTGRRSVADDAIVEVQRVVVGPVGPIIPTPGPVNPTPGPIIPTPVIPTPGPIIPTPGPVIPTPGPIRPTRPSRTRRKKETP